MFVLREENFLRVDRVDFKFLFYIFHFNFFIELQSTFVLDFLEK